MLYPVGFSVVSISHRYFNRTHRRKLTDIINEDHENVKYLPGVELPTNLPLALRGL